MNAHKLSVKIFTESDDFDTEAFVPIFHRWIQDQSLADHLLIDVADYAHVPNGPGSLLVTHEANIHMERTGGRLGLLYFRKTALPGGFSEKLKKTIEIAQSIAAKLAAEPEFAGKLKFKTDELAIRIHDRLNAPNTPETFEATKTDIESVAKSVLKVDMVQLDQTEPDQLFGVDVTTNAKALNW